MGRIIEVVPDSGCAHLLLFEGLLVQDMACDIKPRQVGRVLHCQVGGCRVASFHVLFVPLHPSIHAVASLLLDNGKWATCQQEALRAKLWKLNHNHFLNW